jgi:predicted outer membrane protein
MQPDSAMMDEDHHDTMRHDRKDKMKKGGRYKDKDGKMEALMNATGPEFDSKWVSHMLSMHQAKLRELNTASSTVTEPQLKTIITSAIPKVQMHIDRLTTLKQTTNSTKS